MNNQKSYNRISVLLRSLLTVCLVFALFPVFRAEAQEEGAEGKLLLRCGSVQISLSYGVVGKARYGRDTVMNGTVTAGTLPDGRVEFILTDLQENTQTYSTVLTGEQQESFLVVLPMHRYLSGIIVRVYDAEDQLLTERAVPLDRILMGSGRTVGVLGSYEQGNYSSLSAFGNYVLSLSGDCFPTTAAALCFFDRIVLDGYAEGMLSTQQEQALTDWVRNGGTLVVGTGVRGEETLTALSAAGLFSGTLSGPEDRQTCYGMSDDMRQQMNKSILNFESERIMQENASGSSEAPEAQSAGVWGHAYLGSSVSSYYKEDHASALYAAESGKLYRFLIEDARTVVTEEGEPLVYAQTYGDGTILWFTFSLSRKSMDYYGVYFSYLVSYGAGETKQTGLSTEEQRDSLSYVAGGFDRDRTVPSMTVFAVLLTAYLLVLGPVLFLLLRRTKRKVWLFGMVPAVSVLFLLLLYGIGGRTRIRQPYLTYSETVYVTEDGASAVLNLLAAAPTGEKWKLSLGAADRVRFFGKQVYGVYDITYLNELKRTYAEKPEQSMAQTDGQETELIFSEITAFDEVTAELTYQTTVPELTVSELTLTEQGVAGNLTNSSETEFAQVYLYYEGILVTTKQVSAGQSLELQEMEQKSYSSANLFYLDWEETTPAEQYAGAFLRNRMGDSAAGNCMLAVTEEASGNNPVRTDGENGYTTEMGLTMYAAELPAPEQETFGILKEDRMKVLEGEYEAGNRYRTLYSDVLVVEYEIGAGHLAELSFLPLYNREYDSYYGSGFAGSIFLYHTETGNYDLLTASFRESVAAPADCYVSDTGRIRVRFEKNPVFGGAYMELPVLTYRMEQKEDGGQGND